MSKKRIIQISILILLIAFYGLFFVHKIDLTTADLGRHLKNGELILNGDFGILGKNFYSYTEPDFPVVNHHWGGGVIFFLIEKISGFWGLGLFYLILSLIIFYLFFNISEKESGFWISALVSLPLIPLMASRTEIRPEIFSYFFIAFFFWILWRWRNNELGNKWLWLLPILEVIWVNTHIYFVFGPALIGLFLLKELKNKKLWSILGLTFLTTLINPFFIKGLLYPFNIFRNYGYKIVENQSIWFLERLGVIQNPNLTLFKITFGLLVLSFILVWLKKKFNLTHLILGIVFSILGWLAIRNFPLFGLFALPIISFNISQLGVRIRKRDYQFGFVILGLAIFLIILVTYQTKLPFQKGRFGFGLYPGNNQSAQFFKELNLKGPVFNNYDIGGYLIYHLYPEKVFTDNRPEAYSVSHFKDEYIPAQQDNIAWKNLSQKYSFNAVFFSHRDYTPWGQNFLIERVSDPDWAPVFADQFTIIFLKRNDLNQPIINQYEISKNNFGIR